MATSLAAHTQYLTIPQTFRCFLFSTTITSPAKPMGSTSLTSRVHHSRHFPFPLRRSISTNSSSSVRLPLLKSGPPASISSGLFYMGEDRCNPVFSLNGRVCTGNLRRRVGFVVVRASSGGKPEFEDGGGAGSLLVASCLTIALAVANRVLYKLALVPMKDYPFFMAQLTTFGYVAIYFSILYGRYRTNIVTKEMLDLPKSRFVAIGFLEALGLAAGMSAGAMLPGPAIPILSQAFLVWQLIFSVLILGRRYSPNQVIGCLLVAGGVVIAVGSGAEKGQFLSQVGLFWPSLMIVSTAFQAGASILKEFVFVDAATRLKGKAVDLFVVNSFGSGFQAGFVFLLLPFLSKLKGIPFHELPSYLRNGAGCFLNIEGKTEGCEGAPWLPLLYIVVNMAFNISALHLLKISSAVVSSLSITLAVPLSIFILSLPLPYLPQGSSLDAFFVTGVVVLVLGLMLYNFPQSANQSSKSD